MDKRMKWLADKIEKTMFCKLKKEKDQNKTIKKKF